MIITVIWCRVQISIVLILYFSFRQFAQARTDAIYSMRHVDHSASVQPQSFQKISLASLQVNIWPQIPSHFCCDNAPKT